MPSKGRREQAAQSGGVDLLSFFEGGSAAERAKPAEAAAREAVPRSAPSLEGELVSFIRSRGGRVTKTELYGWAKRRNIPPAHLYNTIVKMISENKLKRLFDSEHDELAYELL